MAGNAAGERKLLEQPLQATLVPGDIRIDFAVGAFEIGIRHKPWPTMTGPSNINHVEIVVLDNAVQMHVNEVQARSRAPMTKQAWFDMGSGQWSF